MPEKRSNFYALLGLLRSATPDEIRRAYLKAAKKLHPDKNQAPGETELFLDVQQAYQILLDPQRRAAYDAALTDEKEDLPIEFPLNCKLELSRPHIYGGKDRQLVYGLVTISVKPEQKKNAKSPPLNICLALDCSTSMQGEKMDRAKSSAIQLINRLGPDDIFSLVRFSDRAEVAVPATRNIDLRRSELQIRALSTGGGTEILHGLTAALEEVRRYNNPQYVNHVILLTDGRTYGDEQQCYKQAQLAAEDGIGITGMGIGSGWNDVFLDHLASLAGANTVFIQKPEDIERFLQEKFSNLSRAFAQSVELFGELHDGVVVECAFRLQPETSALSWGKTTSLGPVLYDEPLRVILEFGIDSDRTNLRQLDLFKGQLDASIISSPMPVPSMPFSVSVSVDDEASSIVPPPALLQALSRLNLYRMQEKARNALDAGDYEKATRHLQQLATHLLAQGEKNLAKTILLEAQHIEQQKSFTESGEKQIKYGTRSLLMPGERIL
jgi:Ca-activated chloride channel homolog